MRRRLNGGSDSGAAAVEFALVFPMLIVLLFGIVEFGSVYNTQLMLTSAAREAARSMAVTGDVGLARTAALDAAVGLSPALAGGDVAITPGTCSATTDIEVSIAYDKPYLTGLFGATIELHGIASRRCFG